MKPIPVAGAFQLGAQIPKDLKEGDVLRDQDGKGQFAYTNKCVQCNQLYLAGARIFADKCIECIPERIVSAYYRKA